MAIFERTVEEMPDAKRFDVRIERNGKLERRSYDRDELRENEKFLERRLAEESRIRISDANARENAIEFEKDRVRVLKSLHEPVKKKGDEPDRATPADWKDETLEERKKRLHSRPVDPEWERPEAKLELRPPLSGAEAEAIRHPIRDRQEEAEHARSATHQIEFERS
jgi:hypothetical protein